MSTAASAPVVRFTPALVYRRMLKLYLYKFQDDHETIIRAWRQTKFEFYYYAGSPAEDVPHLMRRAAAIHDSILCGIVPIVKDPKTGEMHVRYDKPTLDAAGGHAEPVDAEEFLRRHHKKFDKTELAELQTKLREVGRWNGPMEFRPSDSRPKYKSKKKKCTDPDPPADAEYDENGELMMPKTKSS